MTQPIETPRRFKEVLELPEPLSTARPSGWVASSRAALRDPGEASDAAVSLARALGLTITAADALHRAGRGADEETRRFLEPLLAHLTPPDAMIDRQVAAE